MLLVSLICAEAGLLSSMVPPSLPLSTGVTSYQIFLVKGGGTLEKVDLWHRAGDGAVLIMSSTLFRWAGGRGGGGAHA